MKKKINYQKNEKTPSYRLNTKVDDTVEKISELEYIELKTI